MSDDKPMTKKELRKALISHSEWQGYGFQRPYQKAPARDKAEQPQRDKWNEMIAYVFDLGEQK